MLRTTVVLILVFSASASARAQAPPRAGGAEAFVQRVRTGDVRAVRRMLARGADPNSESAKGAPAVVLASRAGSATLVRLLLDAGANVNAEDRDQYTALHYAARLGDAALVELLLARGADVNKRGYEDHTVLMFAMHGANWVRMPRPLRELILRDGEGEGYDLANLKRLGTPEAYRRVAARLIKAGAEVNVTAGCGEVALEFATCDVELTKMLLAAGARADFEGVPLCPVAEGMQKKFTGSSAAEFDGKVLSRRERRVLADSARRWAAETAYESKEVRRLLVEAGATNLDCGDDDEQ